MLLNYFFLNFEHCVCDAGKSYKYNVICICSQIAIEKCVSLILQRGSRKYCRTIFLYFCIKQKRWTKFCGHRLNPFFFEQGAINVKGNYWKLIEMLKNNLCIIIRMSLFFSHNMNIKILKSTYYLHIQIHTRLRLM